MAKEATKDTKSAAAKQSSKKQVTKAKKNAGDKPARAPRKWTKPFRAIGTYVKGSWYELRQVRWPNRKQTWALTLAVILFSLFFGVVIFLLDFGFTVLFKEVIL